MGHLNLHVSSTKKSCFVLLSSSITLVLNWNIRKQQLNDVFDEPLEKSLGEAEEPKPGSKVSCCTKAVAENKQTVASSRQLNSQATAHVIGQAGIVSCIFVSLSTVCSRGSCNFTRILPGSDCQAWRCSGHKCALGATGLEAFPRVVCTLGFPGLATNLMCDVLYFQLLLNLRDGT